MKRRYILIALLPVFAGSILFAQGKKFNLNVNIKGITNGKAVISFPFNDKKIVAVDTVSITKGKFFFTGEITAPILSSITILPQKIRFQVFIEKGKISVEADTSNKNSSRELVIKTDGSKSHKEYELVSSFFRSQIDSVYELLKKEKDELRKNRLSAELEKFQDKNKEKVMEFVSDHLNSAVSAYFLIFNTNDYYNDFKKLEKIFNNLGPVAKASCYYEKIKSDFDAIVPIQPGKSAPDFTLNTPEGKPLAMSSFKGTYLLLDFWASWCRPCRESFPRMKEVYKKYHDKGFEILGISDDSKKDAWLKALADDKISWPQVIDEFPQKNKPARVGSLYAAHYIPYTLLLDKEGKIIAKNLSEEKLIEKLEELLVK